MERRDFIRMLGIAGTSATAYAACSTYMQEALAASTVIDDLLTQAAQCKLGSLKDIEHVIFLMQENRSFDHYYGTMRGVRGFGDSRPLRLKTGDPVFNQRVDSQNVVKPFQARRGSQSAGDFNSGDFGLPHGYNDGLKAVAKGWNDAWMSAKGKGAMVHFDTRKDLSYYAKLIDAFTICDGYHCSVPAGTDPNRSHFWSGTAKGLPVNTYFSGSKNSTVKPDWKTYPEHLQGLGIQWKFYQNGINDLDINKGGFTGDFEDNTVVYFKQFWNDRTSEIFKRCATPNTILRTDPNKPSQFEQDVASGQLPPVSWIVAPTAFSEHPSSVSPHFGEYYTNEILKVLAAHPNVWKKTVFILNYDENDGFFDHVPPPAPPLPALNDIGVGKVSEGISIPKTSDLTDVNAEYVTRTPGDTWTAAMGQTQPMGLGTRVPCVIVSPWTVGGRVCSELFDHTSTLRFLDVWLAAKGLQKEGTTFANISSWRRAICGDLTSAFDFTPKLDTAAKAGSLKLDDAVKAAVPIQPYLTKAEQDAIVKPAYASKDADIAIDLKLETRLKQDRTQVELLPLGYDFNVYGSVSGEKDKRAFNFTFHNKSTIGVALNVYSYNAFDQNRGAWFYALTRAADKPIMLVDSYDLVVRSGKYEFAVHGPNGYLTEFAGNTNHEGQLLIADIIDVKAIEGGKKVEFDFGKWGATANADVMVVNAYTGEISTIAAGTESVTAATKDGWYDVSFIDKAGTGYLRRYAGHLENGKISKTDPAIGLKYDMAQRVYDQASA
jgi:phospholipase C